MSEATEFEAMEAELNALFGRYGRQELTRPQLDDQLAKLKERIKHMRMPSQNYFNGYLTARFHALGEPE